MYVMEGLEAAYAQSIRAKSAALRPSTLGTAKTAGSSAAGDGGGLIINDVFTHFEFENYPR